MPPIFLEGYHIYRCLYVWSLKKYSHNDVLFGWDTALFSVLWTCLFLKFYFLLFSSYKTYLLPRGKYMIVLHTPFLESSRLPLSSIEKRSKSFNIFILICKACGKFISHHLSKWHHSCCVFTCATAYFMFKSLACDCLRYFIRLGWQEIMLVLFALFSFDDSILFTSKMSSGFVLILLFHIEWRINNMT